MNVILIPPFQTLTQKEEVGEWINGKFIKEEKSAQYKGKLLPLRAYELSNINGGAIHQDSRKFYTKEKIKINSILFHKSRKYRVISCKDYDEQEADIKIYILEYIETGEEENGDY